MHVVVESADKAAKAELAHAIAVADAVAIARDFVNTPPSHLYPEEFAERARELGAKAGLKVEILDFDSSRRTATAGSSASARVRPGCRGWCD